MKFFLDSANLGEIREAAELGLIDGVTTNPSLIAKEGEVDFKQHVAAICEIVHGDVSVEVTSPLTRDGLKATKRLTGEGIKVNVTLCFSAAQAILAAKAGAAYISPFLGRLDDIGQNGLELLAEIVEIYSNYDWKTEVLAASIRSPVHVIEAARIGADVATMPFKVLEQLIRHPLTDKGLEQFLADWRKSGKPA